MSSQVLTSQLTTQDLVVHNSTGHLHPSYFRLRSIFHVASAF